MAEGVVGSLIGKLGAALAKEAATYGASLLCQEVSALKRLFAQIRDVKDELESMEAFLHGAERFKDIDETTGNYVKKIRGLAFEIEDAVDEFTYKLEDKHGGFTGKMRKRIKHVKAWRRLALRLQDIKQRLENADRRKVRYDLSVIGSSGHSKSPEQSFQFAREEDLVGIEINKELLMQWLAGDSEQGCKIATVWGMGGVGKTTLVSHVYKTVKLDFDVSGFVTVTNSYQFDDLLKKISTEFEIPIDADNIAVGSLVESIHHHLQGKRYILVLDDVWQPDVWFKLRNAFPTESTGRFIFTTRMQEVALLATKKCAIELAPLDAHCSWQLFCKEAFWNADNKTCPEELQDIALMFVDKCAGLPIAIACIGRLLSCKHPIYSEWEHVYKDLELQLTNNVILDADIVLKVSLEDLQRNLKNCFLHCTIFPESYAFNRKRLIRHWIAAGYIQEVGSKTVEEVAEGYLNELVNRSLLQVVERNLSGRVRSGSGHTSETEISICASTEVLHHIGCLTKLRTFAIGKVRTEHCADLCDAIMRMTHLVRITINSADEEEVLQLETLRLPSTISKIELGGMLSKESISRLISTSSNLVNLTELNLGFSKFNEDSFACLLNLHNLVELYLSKAYDGRELIFHATSFPKLKLLSVWDAPNLRKIAIQQGALQSLVRLFLADCPELRDVPDGIKHLRTLEYLRIKGCSDELRRKLEIKGKSNTRNEDRMKISHVKWVEIVLEK
ncbi:hypothetical protein OsI_02353 [Oryza sativa Indica Group]|uniref:Uncharacterized protein n=1 Tax=Oryza sativa subsp. indica TaxID=39946 RepID=B8A9Z7_ORYSI|nr:hypothetical protein OsI_02353 [Oryza sativa Indica Group]